MKFFIFLICISLFSCTNEQLEKSGIDETEILNLVLDDFLFNSGICYASTINFMLDSTLEYGNNQCIHMSNERIERIHKWKNAYLVLVLDSTLNIEYPETKELIEEYFDFEKIASFSVKPFKYRKKTIFKGVKILERMPSFKEYRHVKISGIFLSKDTQKAVIGLERPVSCFSLETTYFLIKIEGQWVVNFKMD